MPDLETYLQELCKKIPEPRRREEVAEELRSHILDSAEFRETRGETPEAALAHALEEMGDPLDVSEKLGAVNGWFPALGIRHALNKLWWGFLFCHFAPDVWHFQTICRLLSAFLPLAGLWQLRRDRRFRPALIVAFIRPVCMGAVWVVKALPPMGVSETLQTLLSYADMLTNMLIWCLAFGAVAQLAEGRCMDRLYSCRGWYIALIALTLTAGFNPLLAMVLAVLIVVLPIPIAICFHIAKEHVWLEGKEPAAVRPMGVKNWCAVCAILLVVFLVLPVGTAALVHLRPTPVTHLELVDLRSGKVPRAEAARENLAALGFPEKILNDMPMSELLYYEDTAYVSEAHVQHFDSEAFEGLACTALVTWKSSGEGRAVLYMEWEEPPEPAIALACSAGWAGSAHMFDTRTVLPLYGEGNVLYTWKPRYTDEWTRNGVGGSFEVPLHKGQEGQRIYYAFGLFGRSKHPETFEVYFTLGLQRHFLRIPYEAWEPRANLYQTDDFQWHKDSAIFDLHTVYDNA